MPPTEHVFKHSKIKKKLPMSLIEQIDKELIESGMIDGFHDGSGGPSMFLGVPYDVQNKEELRHLAGKIVGVKVPLPKRMFFVKTHEVYIDPKAKELLAKGKAGALLFLHSSFITLVFDYRSNVGKIEMESKEFKALVKLFPILNCIIEDNNAR